MEACKEVIETFQKALQYCDLTEENNKLPLYQFRAAMIHYRLGSLYHHQIYTGSVAEANKKNITQLAKMHYEKSSNLYFVLNDGLNYFTSQMQRVALNEFLAESKLKTYYLM